MIFGKNGLIAFMKMVQKSGAYSENEPFLHDYALSAYLHCCEWLGPPADPHFRFELIRWHRSMCARAPLIRRYILLICDRGGFEATCRDIGHEMYHRFWWRPSGLCKQLWADEMLACLVSDAIMGLNGMENYVTSLDQASLSSDKVDVVRLRHVRRRRRFGAISQASASYPQYFARDVIRLGMALTFLCPWECLTGMPAAATLNDWMGTLPTEYQFAAGVILGLNEPDMTSTAVGSESRFMYYQAYGRALYSIGDSENAVNALQIARDTQSDDAEIHLHLANALWQAGRRSDATRTLRQGLEIDPSSVHIHHALGYYAREERDPIAAVEEYRTLIRLDPEDYNAGYYLGLTLYDQGAFKEAETVLASIPLIDNDWTHKKIQRLLALVSDAGRRTGDA